MKKTIAVLMAALLLGGLAGCAKEPAPVPAGTQAAAPTVENLFTQPKDSQETETAGDSWSYLVESFRYAATESNDNGSYCTYAGGEMHLPSRFCGRRKSAVAKLIHLLMDALNLEYCRFLR